MSRSGIGRRDGVVLGTLLAAGSLAIVGLLHQQLVEPAVAAAPAPVSLPAPATRTQPEPRMMNAAVATGTFEEVIKPTPVPTALPAPTPTSAEPASAPEPDIYESGIASTYGEDDGFDGRLTACGQVFRTSIIQLAHKSLPCGTMVRVEDADTGRSVVAEVTDRGPYIRGRVVDLSWGAFKQLDPTGPGLLKVNVYLLED